MATTGNEVWPVWILSLQVLKTLFIYSFLVTCGPLDFSGFISAQKGLYKPFQEALRAFTHVGTGFLFLLRQIRGCSSISILYSTLFLSDSYKSTRGIFSFVLLALTYFLKVCFNHQCLLVVHILGNLTSDLPYAFMIYVWVHLHLMWHIHLIFLLSRIYFHMQMFKLFVALFFPYLGLILSKVNLAKIIYTPLLNRRS